MLDWELFARCTLYHLGSAPCFAEPRPIPLTSTGGLSSSAFKTPTSALLGSGLVRVVVRCHFHLHYVSLSPDASSCWRCSSRSCCSWPRDPAYPPRVAFEIIGIANPRRRMEALGCISSFEQSQESALGMACKFEPILKI